MVYLDSIEISKGNYEYSSEDFAGIHMQVDV